MSLFPEDPRQRWSSLDQAARDAAYDNNAAVADSPRWIERRNRDSAAYRSTHNAKLDLPYANISERTAIDLYPSADKSAPCLVFLHGGYWQRNSREGFACVAEGPNAAGWSVAIPGYSLAPQASLADIVAEIGRAIDWLAAHKRAHGIGGPLVIAGWSAGAQLAAFHLGHPDVVAGLAVSGVYDLAPLRETGLNNALNLSETELETLSPLRLVPAAKPLTIAYGDDELPALVHDSLKLFALRQAHGAAGAILPVADANHFSILPEFQKADGVLVKAAIELLSHV
ncbi:alpha/beta hydrolase [Bradyrhizobium sp. LTSPM299]|uniref:alpha/beta hydrolase n=1 Tax=Bradyrhizobium sp. LTSPM299 TaxID=1619233 RepID=UPI000A7EB4A7|nr:alpha/beta hydrolase [Bradyrhizobium sp. LTSPM299]